MFAGPGSNPGHPPYFECHSLPVVEQVDCATLIAAPINFVWADEDTADLTFSYAYPHDNAGMQAAWRDMWWDFRGAGIWRIIASLPGTPQPHNPVLLSVCNTSYTPPPPWTTALPPEFPHWSGTATWNGTTSEWDCRYAFWRMSPELDLSSLGYSSTTHIAHLFVTWQANVYSATTGSRPYPWRGVAEKCYDITPSLDGPVHFDQLFIPFLDQTWVAHPGTPPTSVTNDLYAGGWTMDDISAVIYELP